MIKVINFISDTNIGGAGKCIINFANNFDINKFKILVVVPKGSLLVNELNGTSVKVIEIDGMKDKSIDLSAVPKIREILKKEKPDIVHTHASFTARVVAKQYKKCKIVFSKHCDFAVGNNLIKRKLNKFINNKFADKIISTSEMAKDNLVKMGVLEDKISVVLNGVNKLNKISNEEKLKLKDKYNISDKDIVIGYLARIEELKGHKFLVEAAKILDDKFKGKFKFLLMGTGSYEEELKKYVHELDLENTVIFTGFIKDVGEMLNIVDVQVNASYLSETTNLALLEGMSLGIPSVVTRCGGNPKVIINDENGLVVEKADGKALAEGIENIVADNEKLNKMKENSLRIFDSKYTAKIYTENIEKIYESMVK